ncbi:hypothetical protein [Paenibacillus chibensis]|uniref:hypothetical protein n=1 Tax=Paenibacillus chibensis TaxID=59846 RepID=UPI000FD9C86F|nr:hypothetical protein [Paenibacillus chibensis]MEC0371014.1 hypothetical protein [Paenibacillus chibensis]
MDPDELIVTLVRDGKQMSTRVPLRKFDKFVFVINDQFTNAPNTTQIASGAGRSSAAGSNAAIKSPFTQQQESIGAGGKAKNILDKKVLHPLHASPSGKRHRSRRKEAVFIINHQVVKLPRNQRAASATQIASGAGKYSTGGTNAAIESPFTKQQQAVGGGQGGRAVNKLRKQGGGRRRR